MYIGCAVYSNANPKKVIILNEILQKAKPFFETRDYGNGIQRYVIGIICMSPEFDTFYNKNRKKYSRTKRLLEYDIRLNYARFEKATQKGIERMFAQMLINSLGIIEELKIQNFDTNRFREDLIRFFQEKGIKWDREPAALSSPHLISEMKEQNSRENQSFEFIKEGLDNIAKISLLSELKTKNKFTAEAWEERGLNPSGPEIINAMNQVVDKLIEKIIIGLKADYDEQALKQIIKQVLVKVDEFRFDTEELELLCDWIEALACLVNININKELNKCLYGDISSVTRAGDKGTTR